MPSSEDSYYTEECEAIKQERTTYKLIRPRGIVGFESALSAAFYFAAFIALILVPFTEITLLQATCLFVIHYTIAPSEVDLGEALIKGIAEDLGHIRANLAAMRIRNNEIKDNKLSGLNE